MFKKFFVFLYTFCKFKINLGGMLFWEYFLASIVLCLALGGIMILMGIALWGPVALIAGFFYEVIKIKFLGDLVMGSVIYGQRFLIFIFFPLFLIGRLILVYRESRISGFFGALIGELICVIPFAAFIWFATMMWSTF